MWTFPGWRRVLQKDPDMFIQRCLRSPLGLLATGRRQQPHQDQSGKKQDDLSGKTLQQPSNRQSGGWNEREARYSINAAVDADLRRSFRCGRGQGKMHDFHE
jgi:hypothetical protein